MKTKTLKKRFDFPYYCGTLFRSKLRDLFTLILGCLFELYAFQFLRETNPKMGPERVLLREDAEALLASWNAPGCLRGAGSTFYRSCIDLCTHVDAFPWHLKSVRHLFRWFWASIKFDVVGHLQHDCFSARRCTAVNVTTTH